MGPTQIVFGFKTVQFVRGVYQNFFQPAKPLLPLETLKLNKIEPPVYSPPVNFNLQAT